MARWLSVAVGCCVLAALVLGATAGAGAPPPPRAGASVVVVERLPTLLHNELVRGAELAAPRGPIALVNGTASSGYPLAGSGPTGETVRFIDQGTFWIAVLVRNRSAKQTVTVVDARTPEPLRSLVAQTSAGFSRYKPCRGSMFCGYPNSRTSTAPLRLAPDGMAAVKLSYRLVSCAVAAVSTTASADTLVISYRSGNGPVREQTFPLGGASLRLQKPAGVECLPRPYSHIGLVGSFTTSPGHKPIPGSDGDTCTKTVGGGLAYRSRLFMDRSGTTFRIAINLPHYRGKGQYQPAGSPGGTLGLSQVIATGGFGLHRWTTFRDNASTVAVATASGATLGGRFTAVFSGHRRFFRAYGAWRCTTSR